jgi:predicted nucleic acid-binding protein
MDTDYLSQLQRGDKQILAHLAQIQPQQIGITIITVEEQIRGRLAKIRQKANLLKNDRTPPTNDRPQPQKPIARQKRRSPAKI